MSKKVLAAPNKSEFPEVTTRLYVVSSNPILVFDYAKIPSISPHEIQFISPTGVLSCIRELNKLPRDVIPGFVIDGTHHQDLTNHLLCHPGIAWLESCNLEEMERSTSQEVRQADVTRDPWSTLGLAFRISQLGWLALIVVVNEQPLNRSSYPLSNLASLREFRFRLLGAVDVHKGVQAAIQIINAMQCIDVTQFTVSGSGSPENPFLAPTLAALLRLWENDEFERDEVVADVRKCLGEKEESDQQRHVFLCCVALARQMATRFFERRACSATIVLMDFGEYLSICNRESGTILRAEPIFEFRGADIPTWFHFGDKSLIDGCIETALSERSVLVIDKDTGQVLGVHEQCDTTSHGHTGRYTRFSDLSNNRRTVVAALVDGYVEVYHDGELLLWYDRYRWRSRPFTKLKSWLEEYLERKSAIITVIIAAISLLMDRKEGAILVFAGDGDMKVLKEVKFVESMRPELYILGAQKKTNTVRHSAPCR